MGTSIFDAIYAELCQLLEPLLAAAESPAALDELLDGLGLDLGSVGLAAPFQQALANLSDAVTELQNATSPTTLSDVSAAFAPTVKAITAIESLITDLTNPTTILPAGLADVLAAMPGRLVDYLIGRWVIEAHPTAAAVLSTMQALNMPVSPGSVIQTTAGAVSYVPVPIATVDYAFIFQLLTDPVGQLKHRYLAGASGTAAVAALASGLWPRVAALLNQLQVPVMLGTNPQLRSAAGDLGAAGDALADTLIVIPLNSAGFDVLAGVGDTAANFAMISLMPPQASAPAAIAGSVSGQVSEQFTVGAWDVSLSVSGTARGFAVDSSGNVTLLPSTTPATDNITIITSVTNNGTPDNPVFILGSTSGTRLEISAVTLTATLTIASETPAAVTIELDATGAQLVLDLTDGDGLLGFVAGLLGGHVQARGDVGVGWSRSRGLYLHLGGSVSSNGAQGLSATLPTRLDLGPIHIPELSIGLSLPGDSVGGWIGPDLQFSLGPVSISVLEFGLEIDLGLASGGSGGTLGPLDLAFRFRPPQGASLGISAPAVSGAGLLESTASGQYLGAVDLQIGDLSIAGVGVLSTRSPTGASEFSLVALAAVGMPMVQIGFGFSLVGLGALVAVNRTINVPALQDLTRSGGLSSLLFPADLVHTAPQVASILASLFPAAAGQFVVGPAAHITWGTGGIVDAEAGIWIEFPSPLRVVVLGVMRLTLPYADVAIADLTLDLLGVLDLSAKTLAIDASLRGSSLAGFPLTGSAAIRAGWGTNPEFVIAIGGFYPSFVPPAGFPQLQRVALTIGSGDLQLNCSAYLAVTSNTVQFGAVVSLYASVGPATFSALWSFDALIQIKPFHLELDLQVSLSLSIDGFSVNFASLAMHISGPEPWHISGHVGIPVLFFTISVPISLTIGPSAPPTPPATVDLDTFWQNLRDALADTLNWSFGPPPGASVVVIRNGPPGSPAAVHPLGTLTVRQNTAPLAQRIDRSGSDVLDQAATFTLTNATVGGAGVAATPVTGFFAPAQFITMDDATKLSTPAFEPMTAGATLGPPGPGVPITAGGTVVGSYENKPFLPYVYGTATSTPPPQPTPIALPADMLTAQLLDAAAARANLGRYSGGPTSGIALTPPHYTLAASDLSSLVTAPSGLPAGGFLNHASAYAAARTAVVAPAPQRPGNYLAPAVPALPGVPATQPPAPVSAGVIYASEVPGKAIVVMTK
jgi:hypothetical protein